MPSGFFSQEDTAITRGDEYRRVRKAKEPVEATCGTCGLSGGCLSPRMKPTGEGLLPILVLAEAPGATEDREGQQLVGKAGRALREIVKECGLSLDRHFRKTNAVVCRPPDNEEPGPLQVRACRKRMLLELETFRPRVVLALGGLAMDSLLGERMRGKLAEAGVTDWAGEAIPDQELGVWILPTWHPSYFIRQGDDPVIKEQIKAQILRAVKLAAEPFPARVDYDAMCQSVYDPKEAVDILSRMRKAEWAAFDYETTGRKPERDVQRIISASVSDGGISAAFPFFDEPEFREAWRRFLTAPRVQRIAHNGKYEMRWTRVKLGYSTSIAWDTAIVAHALQNKKRVNLKLHTYFNFGVAGYDDSVEPYMSASKAEEKIWGANAMNTMASAPLADVLHYNALDSLFEFKLREKQAPRISEFQSRGIELFTGASEALVDAEVTGWQMAAGAAEDQKKVLDGKLSDIEQEIAAAPELKNWDWPKPFRPSATGDLNHLLYDILKYKPVVFTEKSGAPKADKAVLEDLGLPFVDRVLTWKKFQKVRDTYLQGWRREAWEGVCHPFYNLIGVDTFRSSSDSPNAQNAPKRDPEQAKVLRSLVRPRPGHRIGEYDYKGAEVSGAACYNLDPVLINYINDSTTDMHRDFGMKIFLRPLEWFKAKSPVAKLERHLSKNKFVFAEFYGDYFKNIAPGLWASMPQESREHLISEGIRSVRDFTSHLGRVEDEMWNERFVVYSEWKEKHFKDYTKNGYVDLFTGFRCWGPMEYNKVINYPIQGTAFHFLLWTFWQVWKEAKKLGLKSELIGQIHDALLIDIDPAEEAWVDRLVYDYGTQKIREHWPWIVVPLSIEKARSAVDGSWAEMEDCGLLKEAV